MAGAHASGLRQRPGHAGPSPPLRLWARPFAAAAAPGPAAPADSYAGLRAFYPPLGHPSLCVSHGLSAEGSAPNQHCLAFDLPVTSLARAGWETERQLVVTAMGPDRPGIVSRLSKRVLECGGNVEESRMVRLAGDFTVLMLVTIDATTPRKAEEVRGRLLELDDLQVSTRWTSPFKEAVPSKRRFRHLALRGADNPGLVYNVTEYLASNDINIEYLETSTQEGTVVQAPFGGTTLFTMEGIIALPPGLPTGKLVGELQALEATLGVEIAVSNLDRDASPPEEPAI
eukprot:SM000450S16326  [mRNA]  locus=s450:23307:24891:- [translate_table: standard]